MKNKSKLLTWGAKNGPVGWNELRRSEKSLLADWHSLRQVFKDYFNRHSDLRWHENEFVGLTSAWKLVIRADIGMETSF